MPLTDVQKLLNKRNRMLENARKVDAHVYLSRKVAPEFQKMVRAEAGAFVGSVVVVKDDELTEVMSPLGMCACITCGKVDKWIGSKSGAAGGGFHTGHFVASRRASIVLEPNNVAPQCSHCNLYEHGNQHLFAMWMRAVRGEDEIDRLRHLKNNVSRKFSRDELVDLRMSYMSRTKAAIEVMDV